MEHKNFFRPNRKKPLKNYQLTRNSYRFNLKWSQFNSLFDPLFIGLINIPQFGEAKVKTCEISLLFFYGLSLKID